MTDSDLGFHLGIRLGLFKGFYNGDKPWGGGWTLQDLLVPILLGLSV